MHIPRRHLNYANVVATLALVFAMSGGALAAKHYLINSTKQINPKVLKKLRGNVGKTGATGPAGAAGLQGKEGPPNPNAVFATNAGHATDSDKLGDIGASHYVTPASTLASGDTETGVYGAGASASGSFGVASITFVPKLAAAPAHAEYISSTTTGHCPGSGHAAAGYFCVYQGWIAAFALDCIGSPPSACGEGPTVDGAEVYFTASGSGANTTGTWAYKAP
jgi:hypothetical protein